MASTNTARDQSNEEDIQNTALTTESTQSSGTESSLVEQNPPNPPNAQPKQPPPRQRPSPAQPLRPRGPLRKPILYIFSPSEIDVSVTLSLIPELRFSALYPVVPAKRLLPSGGEQVEWNVRTRLDGSLIQDSTALEISYLFWEAEINDGAVLSPPHSPTLGQLPQPEQFNPLTCNLHDANSVVLPVGGVTGYLDKTLRALGLHTEARTSFISFWLPSLLKHKYIALRFLSQSAYERSAPMNIDPKPDVVTRVFMLYKGVVEDCVHSEWPNAVACATREVTWWRDVVGVNVDRALDPQLYRVLEWGGMEVV